MEPRFRTVIFDCDSTLTAVEGIEELAREHRGAVADLTEQAMRGLIPLEEVYGRRLALIRPSREAVDQLGNLYIRALVPGAMDTVRALRTAGVVVQVLSGGLAPAVGRLARHLGIPDDRVAAVDIRFDAVGRYAGFDETSPLARSGGKRAWIDQSAERLPPPVLLVGDGATDLEARPAVAAFVAYTGVAAREEVLRHADLVVSGPSLTAVLHYCGIAP
ncbi:MAG TPA: HAD-IB family phosphatase [Gemmatimonadales bacterium]|nr:HAD-IB family phosphatase [Gemmatimonadales bacterium]